MCVLFLVSRNYYSSLLSKYSSIYLFLVNKFMFSWPELAHINDKFNRMLKLFLGDQKKNADNDEV